MSKNIRYFFTPYPLRFSLFTRAVSSHQKRKIKDPVTEYSCAIHHAFFLCPCHVFPFLFASNLIYIFFTFPFSSFPFRAIPLPLCFFFIFLFLSNLKGITFDLFITFIFSIILHYIFSFLVFLIFHPYCSFPAIV